MSEHLPECESNGFVSWQIEECICDRLRACEQRVLGVAWEASAREAADVALLAARHAASNTRGWFTDEYPDSDGTAKPVALIEDVVNRIDALRDT